MIGLQRGLPQEGVATVLKSAIMNAMGYKVSDEEFSQLEDRVMSELIEEFDDIIDARQKASYGKFLKVIPATISCLHGSTGWLDPIDADNVQALMYCLDCGAIGVAVHPHGCEWSEVGYSLADHKKKWICNWSFTMIVGSQEFDPNVEKVYCIDFMDKWLIPGEVRADSE
jgi:hypothetical protein